MKKIFFLIALLICNSCSAQSPSWLWAYGIGSSSIDEAYSIAVDKAGNNFSTGYFNGTVDFDPGPGTFNMTATGIKDIFILKLNAVGNFVWAKRFGGISTRCTGLSIAIDSSDNIYTTGKFDGTIDFNPNAGVFNLISVGYDDIFISKLDSSGNFIWVKQIGGANYQVALSISLDNSDNIYLTGQFKGWTDFDPGPGLFQLSGSGGTGTETFICKLGSTGNFIWAKSVGSVENDNGYSIAVDDSENVYTIGVYKGDADFDPGSGTYYSTSNGWYDFFISKLDNAGNFLWAKSFGSTGYDYGYSLALDEVGNVYATGYFEGTVDFDPNAGIYNLTSNGSSDMFVLKLSPSGNFIWATQHGGGGDDLGYSIKLDGENNLYTTGIFSIGGVNTLLLKLDSSGSFIYTKSWESTGYDIGMSLGIDSSDHVYIVGSFTGITMGFDQWEFANSNFSGLTSDIFIARLSQCTAPSTLNVNDCNSYVSPSGNYVWSASGIYYDIIPNAAGCDSTITIHLTINNSSSSINVQTCNSYTSPSGNNTWSSSGIYTDTLTNAAGCDSIITINLIINNSSSQQTISTCNNFISPSENYTWIISGTYHDTIPNAVGCDSIITINLTINSVDTLLTQNGITLTANATTAIYQWLNCNNGFAAINGATNQTFTATANGNYAVAITQNGCTDTSVCYAVSGVGINEINSLNNFEIFPNPSSQTITLTYNFASGDAIEIKDLLGRIVLSKNTNHEPSATNYTIDVSNLPSALYFISIRRNDGSILVKQFVKE